MSACVHRWWKCWGWLRSQGTGLPKTRQGPRWVKEHTNSICVCVLYKQKMTGRRAQAGFSRQPGKKKKKKVPQHQTVQLSDRAAVMYSRCSDKRVERAKGAKWQREGFRLRVMSSKTPAASSCDTHNKTFSSHSVDEGKSPSTERRITHRCLLLIWSRAGENMPIKGKKSLFLYESCTV